MRMMGGFVVCPLVSSPTSSHPRCEASKERVATLQPSRQRVPSLARCPKVSSPHKTSIKRYPTQQLPIHRPDTSNGDASKSPANSVSQAIATVNTVLAPPLIGKDPTKQAEIDQLICRVLEKSGDKSEGGASAILAVSLAVCRAGEASSTPAKMKCCIGIC